MLTEEGDTLYRVVFESGMVIWGTSVPRGAACTMPGGVDIARNFLFLSHNTWQPRRSLARGWRRAAVRNDVTGSSIL